MTSRYRQTMAEAMEKVHLSEKEISKLRNGVKVLGNALPNRAIAQKMADKANKEMGHDADVYHSPFNNRFYVRIKEETLNEKDHEISMARGELEAISDKALKLSSILQGKSDDDQLEAWVQSKITKAKDYINSVADYMEYNPDMANEELEEAFNDAQIAKLKKEYEPLRGKKISIDNANKLGAMFTKFDKDKNALEKLYGGDIPFISTMAMTRLMTKHNYKAADLNKLRKEEWDLLEEAELLGEGTGTISGFRTDSEKANVMSLAKQHGVKADDIGSKVKLTGNMRAILDIQLAVQKNGLKAEEVDLVEFTTQQIKMAYGVANDKRYKAGNYSGAVKAIEKIAKGLSQHPDVLKVLKKVNEDLEEGKMSQIDQMQKDGKSAAEIAKALGVDVKVVKGILGEEKKEEEKEEEKPEVKKEEPKKEDDKEKIKADLSKKDNEIALLKTKIENEKNAAVKPEPNPETGEIPLKVGIAYKILKDKMKSEKEVKKEEVSKDGAYAIGMAQAKKKYNDEPPLDKKTITKGHEIAKSILKKENSEHPAKVVYESIEAVKKKAEKTGMPYSVLKQVYDRGMAAWRGGHRPGATQVQWALARVNSFVTKSSGTWGGADKDLAAKVKGSK